MAKGTGLKTEIQMWLHDEAKYSWRTPDENLEIDVNLTAHGAGKDRFWVFTIDNELTSFKVYIDVGRLAEFVEKLEPVTLKLMEEVGLIEDGVGTDDA